MSLPRRDLRYEKSIRILAIILSALLFAVSTVNVVFAISTADAKEWIDTEKSCSLTLSYAIDGKKIEGLEIEIYQTATVTDDFRYSMTGDFADYPIEINGIKSQSKDGNTIQITNTRPDDPPPPPHTGDTSNLYIWIILMALSGTVLVILSIRRKKEEKTL